MPHSFKRTSILGASVLVGSLLLAPTQSLADPDSPEGEPTIEEVEQRIADLQHEAEIASEKLNTVREQLRGADKRLDTLNADVDRQRTVVTSLRGEVAGDALADYQNAAGLSTTTSLLVSDDPGQFMNDLATSSVVEHQQAGLLTRLVEEQRQLGVQEQQAQREFDAIAEKKEQLGDHKEELEDKTTEAEEVLEELEEEERQRLLALQRQRQQEQTETTTTTTTAPSRDTERPTLDAPPASGRAAAAVEEALAQVGDPYVYGAAGPDAFDCSGLTMYAWAAAGVSLPHSSSMQVSSGTPVSTSDLQPGDLVFYYSPISHVGIYIGDGQIVHAANSSIPVQVADVYSMPISAATRPG